MQLFFLTLSLFFSVTLRLARAEGNDINPSTLKVCKSQPISINSTFPPFTVVALSSDDLQGQPLSRIATNVSDSKVDWIVDVPAGSNITIGVKDGNGTRAYSSPMSVEAGGTDSCLPTNSSVATSQAPDTADSASPSSSASFDPQSISSLIDSLTQFTPPLAVATDSPTSTTLLKSPQYESKKEEGEKSNWTPIASKTASPVPPPAADTEPNSSQQTLAQVSGGDSFVAFSK
ncbi:hypothetical protein JCM5350_000645 [Sporobolomyces pararoseus]